MPTSDSIKSEQSSSSSSEPEDHSSSQEMLHLSSVGDGAGVGPFPKPSPRLQPNNNNNNNNPHKTRVVVCGLPAAGSDFAASAKPSRRRRGGGPPASSNKKAKTSSPKSTTHTRQEAIDGGGDDVEITLLKGLSEYSSKTGIIPRSAADFQAFCDFIVESDSFTLGFSRSQLINKVKNLRRMYSKHAAKESGGVDPTFLKNPHERLRYDLSKTIWGCVGGGNSDEVNKAAKKDKVLACLRASASGQTTNSCRASLLRQGLLLVGESPSPNFVEKWNALLGVEMKLYLRRAALIQEQIQLLANI